MSDDRSDKNYEVGYGKPPVHTQFKPGQSGNPKGRPKKEISFFDALVRACERPVKMREGGEEITVTSLEAMITRQVTEAIQGDTAALKILLPLIERWLQPRGQKTDASEVDHIESLKTKLGAIANRYET